MDKVTTAFAHFWSLGTVDKIFCAIFIILFLAIVALVAYGILCGVNFLFRPTITGKAKIVKMEFEAAHYSTSYVYNAATKTSMPVTTWHPNAWRLILQIDGCEDTFPIDPEKYVRHKVGEWIPVEYTTGRLWKSVIIKSATV